MITLKRIITEDTIANIVQSIRIVLEIDRTTHAKERQSRHGFGEDEYISDEEIVVTAKKAIESIGKMLLFNYIDIGDTICIKNNRTNLNLVGQLKRAGDKIDLVIITVMRKKDFKVSPETKRIEV